MKQALIFLALAGGGVAAGYYGTKKYRKHALLTHWETRAQVLGKPFNRLHARALIDNFDLQGLGVLLKWTKAFYAGSDKEVYGMVDALKATFERTFGKDFSSTHKAALQPYEGIWVPT